MIPHHHNPPSSYNKECAARPGENGLEWLKMGENGWQFKCAPSSMHKKRKNPVVKQQTCEKGPKLGFKELPTYKSLHCVRTVWALRARHSLRQIKGGYMDRKECQMVHRDQRWSMSASWHFR